MKNTESAPENQKVLNRKGREGRKGLEATNKTINFWNIFY